MSTELFQPAPELEAFEAEAVGAASTAVDPAELPRLVYIGQPPVEESVAGSLLLWRLFETYPREKLLIVEAMHPSREDRRLAGVRYLNIKPPGERITRTRLAKWTLPPFELAMLVGAKLWATAIRRAIRPFVAEAVVTVAEGMPSFAALAFAERQGLPLHVIVHDDQIGVHWISPAMRARYGVAFAKLYRRATTRFCVSPRMERAYKELFGSAGTVLYPIADRRVTWRPVAREIRYRPCEVAAFFGTIGRSRLADQLLSVAEVLARRGMQLVLFGPTTTALEMSGAVRHPGVRYLGFLPSEECRAAVRRQAHLLVLPFSFEPADRMDLSFPSKLVDYTALGLPILALAPPDSTVAEWVRDNPDSALLVTEDTAEALGAAVDRLISDPALRERLARGALAAGARCFAHEKVFGQFAEALAAAHRRWLAGRGMPFPEGCRAEVS